MTASHHPSSTNASSTRTAGVSRSLLLGLLLTSVGIRLPTATG